jgi:hypothetical protein
MVKFEPWLNEEQSRGSGRKRRSISGLIGTVALANLALAVGARFHPQEHHVGHDDDVGDEYAGMHRGWATDKFGDFKWKIDGAGDESEPLRPSAGAPEAVGFYETHSAVGAEDGDGGPQILLGNAVGEIEEHLCEMAVGIDVKEFEQVVGHVPGIAVEYREKAEDRQERKNALGEFERGDGTKPFEVFKVGLRRRVRFVQKAQIKSPQTDISLSEIDCHCQSPNCAGNKGLRGGTGRRHKMTIDLS